MRKPPDDEDFRKALAGVQPLAEPRRRPHSPPRPAPVPYQSRRDERAVLAESLGPISIDDALDSGEELTYVRAGIGRDVLRKLRSGHWVSQAEPDLHGMNCSPAAVAVREEVLAYCQAPAAEGGSGAVLVLLKS